jgi:hypothetical protein
VAYEFINYKWFPSDQYARHVASHRRRLLAIAGITSFGWADQLSSADPNVDNPLGRVSGRIGMRYI